MDLDSAARPEVFEMFKERGYAIAELNNVLYRKLEPEEKFPSPPEDCEIRSVHLEEAEVAGAIVEERILSRWRAGAYQRTRSPRCIRWRVRWRLWRRGGQAGGLRDGLVIPEHKVFALCGAGTLAEYRGRGLQTALLRARMAAATKAGCEYAVVVTQGGTTSQRNAERLGFRVADSKVTVIKQMDS